MRFGFLWTIVTLGSLIAPCSAQFQGAPPSASVAPPTIDDALLKSLLKATPPELRFRPLDVISVGVYGLTALTGELRIESDGTIRFPFIGKVQIAGLTIPEVEESITTQLQSKGILQDPQVTVKAVTIPWMIVTVSGDVQKPGVIPALGNLTLIDYLSQAGGLQDNLLGSTSVNNSPSSSVVTLVRPSLDQPVSIPLGSDPAHSPYAEIPLFPGDQIRVGRVGQVYAVGAFKYQGSYPLKNTAPTTVIQLMAMAGGIGFEGDRKDARIIRNNGSSEYLLDVNVSKILDGKVADIALQPNDILFVPTNEMKAAIKGGGTGAFVSLANAEVLANR
jgi:polysaccharide export outer membrane protein